MKDEKFVGAEKKTYRTKKRITHAHGRIDNE